MGWTLRRIKSEHKTVAAVRINTTTARLFLNLYTIYKLQALNKTSDHPLQLTQRTSLSICSFCAQVAALLILACRGWRVEPDPTTAKKLRPLYLFLFNAYRDGGPGLFLPLLLH
jgi:hypothetical protein